jgi:integrase
MGIYVSPEQLSLFEMGRVDLPALRRRREALRSFERRAHLTVRGYESDLRVFTRWCVDAGRTALPVDSDTLALYVTWLLTDGGRRSATAIRHLAAIADRHRATGLATPSMSDARDAILSVRKQRNERPQGKTALGVPELAKVARACDSGTNLGARDRALIVLGFATSLRRSELCALQLSDVSFDRKGLAVLVRRSKTDQDGKGRIIGVWAGKRPSTDPVRVLQAWIRKRGSWPGPLFCRVQTGDVLKRIPITGDSVNDTVKRCVARIGLDPAAYGAHSLRAGAITASADLGRSDQEIMGMSGHTSAKVMQMYVRSARLFSGRNPLAGAL